MHTDRCTPTALSPAGRCVLAARMRHARVRLRALDWHATRILRAARGNGTWERVLTRPLETLELEAVLRRNAPNASAGGHNNGLACQGPWRIPETAIGQADSS